MKWMILLIFILTFAISIITLILPYLSKLLFDQGIMPKNINLIIKFGLLLILAHFIKASLNLASNVSFTITSNRFIARVKEDLFNRILKMPMAFFDNKQSGYVLARINEIGSLTAMFSPVIFQFFSSLMSFVGAFIVMFSISRKVMMVAILFLPFFYYLTRKTSGHLRKSSKDLLETSANASGVFQESIAGISEIKELNIENIKSAEIKKHIQTIAKKSIHRGKFMNLGMELITFLTNTSTAVLSIVIGVLVARDELSIGDYVALIQYAGMLYLPILLLSTFSITIQPGLVALSRLSSIFEMNSEEETKGKIKLDCIENIRFEDVHFTYPTADKEALKGISFEIKKGDKIALLGPNGSGKSTIAKLILGFYTNYDGKICINDTELKEINIGSLRKKIGIVSQNVFLFSGTILDNIKMANPQVDNEKLMLVSRHISYVG